MGEGPEAGLLGEPTWAGAINLNSAIGCEQQRREDAKKARGNGKFGRSFAFTCQVVVSDFGEMASLALFSAFASSRLRVFAVQSFHDETRRITGT